MKFNAQPLASSFPNCKMRIGQISEINRLPNAVLITPLFLLYAKGGSVTHLTREVLELVTNISSHAVQIPLANTAQCYNSMKHFKEGISTFAGLKECISYCTVQDPATVTRTGYNEKTSISIWTQTGRKQLTADMYMDMIEAFKPDMYHMLCDGDTNKDSTRKRAQKSVDVTTKMFLTCLARHSKSEMLKHSALLAVIEGGYDLDARQQAAQMFSHHPQVQGFVIDGLHNNGPDVEQMRYNTIEPVITETLKHLPDNKLRVVHGCWKPDVVLELVRAGIDVFDSSLVFLATERGCALIFTYKVLPTKLCNGSSINNETRTCNGIVNGYNSGSEDDCTNTLTKDIKKSCKRVNNNYEIDLKEKVYFDDLSPIMSGCQCLTCRNHTRAYIHHLLNTREMLASVLLMIHNLHHYEQFFNAIRESGKKGQLLTIYPPLS